MSIFYPEKQETDTIIKILKQFSLSENLDLYCINKDASIMASIIVFIYIKGLHQYKIQLYDIDNDTFPYIQFDLEEVHFCQKM